MTKVHQTTTSKKEKQLNFLLPSNYEANHKHIQTN